MIYVEKVRQKPRKISRFLLGDLCRKNSYTLKCFLVGVPSVHPLSRRWTQAETVYSGSAEPDRANTREGNKSNYSAVSTHTPR
ncbi:conserved hypothetical protein [Xenorhabdus nematophila F1]|uniref:Uncharacterized protein n=1 Tax=Xenorhabdus nematophila (strain ATCC 19061 / DSM 3370 / CCUG 14189 / LMG 1036 / NCIMB 9965 / AN6) TaxID=406817 RepID=D3VJA5_XENNA|nr:hypothetical protein XNC1_0587 [Xenorhabdus nematophila ATCC 19061]CCW31960.1 conserved hypothetical protein [Xenorhabdus nematophila F1]CEK21573.1 hypothetical protein XNC2_0574 [Xenorhabdus nematophila AN6/1]